MAVVAGTRMVTSFIGAASLAARRTDALLYKRLATLRTDVPLRETLADLEWRGVRRAAYEAFCQRLGFGNLMSRPTHWAP